MVITVAAPSTAASALSFVSAPSDLALACAAAETSNATTFWPDPTRRPSMPAPIAPTPRKAICDTGLLRFPELQKELVGVPADRRVEHGQGVVVGRVAQDVAFARQLEAGALHLPLDHRLVDPVQLVGRLQAAAGLGGMVLDEEGPARLEVGVDRTVEGGHVELEAGEVQVVVVLRGPDHVGRAELGEIGRRDAHLGD